jgi:hypothetical protein
MNFAIAVMGWSVTVLVSPKQMAVRLENLQNLVNVLSSYTIDSTLTLSLPSVKPQYQLLTAVAFKFAVGDSLPDLPFMTVLDQYVVVNFLFLFLQTMETYFVGAMVSDELSGRDLIPWKFSPSDELELWIDNAVEFEKWVSAFTLLHSSPPHSQIPVASPVYPNSRQLVGVISAPRDMVRIRWHSQDGAAVFAPCHRVCYERPALPRT